MNRWRRHFFPPRSAGVFSWYARAMTDQEREPADAMISTSSGNYPAVVIKPEPPRRVALGLLVDCVALICVTVLIAIGKVTAAEGLPWIGLLLGLKAKSMASSNGKPKPPNTNNGAILSLFGL